jgi:hypothetical protein
LAQLQVLQQQVRDLFEAGGNDLLSRDQHLLDKGLDTILQGSDSMLQQWTISVLLLAQQRSASTVEDYKASLRAERELMERWLLPSMSTELIGVAAPGTSEDPI